jgi:hypothetical protein
MSRILVETEIIPIQCSACSVWYGLDKTFKDRRYSDKQSFYCPNGHAQSWTEGDADRLRATNLRLESQLSFERSQRQILEASKAKLERAHKRLVKSGVCPCCKRSFVALKRHMDTKHPDYEVA